MRKFTLIFFILLGSFACQIDNFDDGLVGLEGEIQVFEAVFVRDQQNLRVTSEESVKLQVIRKGNPNRSEVSFRFLIDREAFPNAQIVEIIALEENADGALSSSSPLIASANPGKGKVGNFTSPSLPIESLTDILLGFSIMDGNGNYLSGGFFDMKINSSSKNGLEVSFQKSVNTEFDVILSSVGGEKLKVTQVLQTGLAISEKEATTLIEELPTVVLGKASKEEANQLKSALEAVGATVDLKRAAEGGGDDGGDEAETLEFDVILFSVGGEKMKVIQVLQT
ncbi:ribosomal protein bL12 [Mongoliitalea lutea]|uniref:Large ribosomal subunit protein bL12 C-terminal domain-containing protein n=1 Tax=Mongoliitalea lutea TaxID=849756 RepID=A0A8J3CUL1_9BACT|nr:ribosomal protein L7/L12 [Mongoliitalea lutea]GHB29032.1 hypothetical protein GCM10008106_07290 [Mongoliitalea lutea]